MLRLYQSSGFLTLTRDTRRVFQYGHQLLVKGGVILHQGFKGGGDVGKGLRDGVVPLPLGIQKGTEELILLVHGVELVTQGGCRLVKLHEEFEDEVPDEAGVAGELKLDTFIDGLQGFHGDLKLMEQLNRIVASGFEGVVREIEEAFGVAEGELLVGVTSHGDLEAIRHKSQHSWELMFLVEFVYGFSMIHDWSLL